MAHAKRKDELWIEPDFGAPASQQAFELDEYDSVERHARALQSRLARHYAPGDAVAGLAVEPTGLSARARAAIIVGSAGLAWLAIAKVLALLIG